MTEAVPAVESLLPFPSATGRGLRIAVIDSGVNLQHSHIVAATYEVSLSPGETGCDDVGHGTAVTAAIQEKAPASEYHVIKLFGRTLRSSTARLLQATEWALDMGIDIVNLSLGTANLEHRPHFERLILRAHDCGMLLVSARSNGRGLVLPGALDGVIGVEPDWKIPRERYRIDSENGAARFWASVYPRSLPGVAPQRNLNGVSFAVANMTGFAARACETVENRSFQAVHQALALEAARLSNPTTPQ